MSHCNHYWIYRVNGYEEGCIPAICSLCGKHGCACDFYDSIKHLPLKEQKKAREELRKQMYAQKE